MTITGLHHFLKSIVVKEHISSFKGKTAAIDIYNWIYKACYRHYEEMRNPQNFHSFLAYIHNRIDLLQQAGLNIICVFDGRSISKKRKEIQKRNAQRQKDFQLGIELTTLSAEDVQILKKKEQHLAEERKNQKKQEQLNEKQIHISGVLQQQKDQQQNIQNLLIDQSLLSEISAKEMGLQEVQKKSVQHQNNIENVDVNIKQHQQQQKLSELISETEKQKQLSSEKERIDIFQRAQKIQERVRIGENHLKRSVVVGQKHICLVMRMLKERKIPFMVAPYESEIQIAKLYHLGEIQLVISQDSDLVIYEIPAIYKLVLNGQCDYVDLKKNRVKIEKGQLLSFINMDKIQKAFVAALAGTDYQQKIEGCGIVNAVKYISQYKNLSTALREMLKDKKFIIPQNYEKKALEVSLIFLMGSCYNVNQKRQQFLDQKILSHIDLMGMTLDQLYQIVGPDYGFNQKMKEGNVQIRSSRVRYFTPLERVAPVQIDLQKYAEVETIYKNKKEEQKKIKKPSIQQSFMNFVTRKLRPQLNLQIKAELFDRAKQSQKEEDLQKEQQQ